MRAADGLQNAHVLPAGEYRYRGIPVSLINRLGEGPDGATFNAGQVHSASASDTCNLRSTGLQFRSFRAFVLNP